MSEQPAAYTPAADTVAALRAELLTLEGELPALYQRIGEARMRWIQFGGGGFTTVLTAEDKCQLHFNRIAALRARITEAAEQEASQ